MLFGTRVVLFLFVTIIVVSGCSNEPFEEPNVLTVSSFSTIDTKAKLRFSRTFGYKSQKLITYAASGTGITTTSRKIYYDGDAIKLIVSDSSQLSRKETTVAYLDGSTYDVTNLITRTPRLDTAANKRDTLVTSELYSERLVQYNSDQHPVVVEMKVYVADTTQSASRTELTWDGGHVTRQVVYDIRTGTPVLAQDVTITYDDRDPIFAQGPAYQFVLGAKDFYWLSSNNPITLTENGTTVGYSYTYNKFGYPNDIISDTGATFGFAYARLR